MNKDCKHDLFHFHTGKQPHLWACIKCKDYAPKPHPFLREDEIRGLIFFAYACREEFFNKTNAPLVVQLTNLEGGKMEITVSIKAKTAAELPAELRKAADALEKEKGPGAKPAKTRKADPVEIEEIMEASSEEAEESLGEDEETTEVAEEQMGFDDMEAEDEVEEKPAKPAKGAKKFTDKDVNEAALAHAKKHKRKATLEVLQKKFKVKSISELKPDQYGAAIAALKV